MLSIKSGFSLKKTGMKVENKKLFRGRESMNTKIKKKGY